MSTDVIQAVNKQIANWTVLYVKLHNYHWYVKGQNFFTLHEKFEEFYDEAAGYIDELAERILAVGGSPIGSIKQCLELASIQESEGGEDASTMVKNIHTDFGTIMNENKQVIELAEKADDQGTADVFLDMQTNLRKTMWMLQAFLG
ncbi:Dps family protein [Bacillus marasmi]|uniref:Dps family protein n=1 Tax=Bacillus marasmi TaxID=1926279 RepID=UPI0011C7099E|nr:Dps family protein [Bacillus marasmi]